MGNPLSGIDKTKRKLVLRMAGTGFALAKYLQCAGLIPNSHVRRFVTQIMTDQQTLNPPKPDSDFVVVEQDEKGFSVVS